VLLNDKNEQISSSLKEEESKKLLKKGLRVEKRTYEGCPRHQGRGEILDIFS
jgi:hypothetical protein